jgi:hypothetical protein
MDCRCCQHQGRSTYSCRDSRMLPGTGPPASWVTPPVAPSVAVTRRRLHDPDHCSVVVQLSPVPSDPVPTVDDEYVTLKRCAGDAGVVASTAFRGPASRAARGRASPAARCPTSLIGGRTATTRRTVPYARGANESPGHPPLGTQQARDRWDTPLKERRASPRKGLP